MSSFQGWPAPTPPIPWSLPSTECLLTLCPCPLVRNKRCTNRRLSRNMESSNESTKNRAATGRKRHHERRASSTLGDAPYWSRLDYSLERLHILSRTLRRGRDLNASATENIQLALPGHQHG